MRLTSPQIRPFYERNRSFWAVMYLTERTVKLLGCFGYRYSALAGGGELIMLGRNRATRHFHGKGGIATVALRQYWQKPR